jgi:hypothetical protein
MEGCQHNSNVWLPVLHNTSRFRPPVAAVNVCVSLNV